MSVKRNIRYKCPFCDNRMSKEDLVVHIQDDHEDELPKDFTAFRYVFNYVNRKPLSYHGKCTECGGPTPWDEAKGRYNRQCGKKACHDSFVAKFEENMINKTGSARISTSAEGQVKMLANRKISGTYKFKDGGVKTYTGSYELKALEFMDKVMEIHSDDILSPGPILEYKLKDGRKFMYITDFYYQPYNLVIEVKDGGNNPNRRNMPEYREKQIAKEQHIIKYTNFNYIRLTDNDFSQLLAVFMDLKMQMVENGGSKRVIHVNEAYDPEKEYDTQMDEIKALNRELNSWKYGVLVNGKVYTKADDIDWSKYKTIPVDLMWKHHVGICWDFVNLEYQWFKERHIPTDCYLFVMQKSDDPDDIVTHTFLIFKLEGKKYWFESSWFSHQGITEVKDYNDVVKALVDKYGDHNYSMYKYFPEGLDKNIDNGKFFERTTRNCIYNYEATNESYIEEADTKLFKNVIDNPEITGVYPFRSSDGIYNVNVTIKGFNKYLRGRSEMLIVDKDKVFLNKNSKGYSIPGGGWEENEDHNLSAIRETNEEARIKVKNVSYVSKYAALFDPKDWVKEKINKENWWYGEYIELYIGEYDGTFKGEVEKIDQQKDMEENGKFYKIKDVYEDLIPQHQKVLSDFVNESYLDEMMAATAYAPVVGMRDCDAYITNYQQNNVFSDDYAVIDGAERTIIRRDKDTKKLVKEKLTEDSNISKYTYRVGTLREVSEKLAPYMDKEVEEGFIEKTLLGKKIYTLDQLHVESLYNPDLKEYMRKKYIIEEYSNMLDTLFEEKLVNAELDSLGSLIEEACK